MKQLFQNPKAGSIEVSEVALPALKAGTLLVHTGCSVISPGTERGTVQAARGSYLSTARARPDLVKRVVDMVKRDGVLSAYQAVQRKLGTLQALGYSSAGTVIAVGAGCEDHFAVGDRVACAGQNVASHAEVVCVPYHLAAKVPEGVSLEEAAFTTIGAIALHGVRQLEPRLGDRVAVIGAGLLGLLTVQLLRASGAKVIAFDLDAGLAARARALGADEALAGAGDAQVAAALAFTGGLGVDGVIVTATAPNDGPMVAAAGMARDRARVVAVGAVPFGLPREIAYPKELELRISRSYGPGRYDSAFEERGVDYPIGYVRWTETRNLEAFLEALADKRVELGSLVTHRYGIDEAPAAYDALMDKDGQRPLGMVIRYPDAPIALPERRALPVVRTPAKAHFGSVGVGFIGAGAFARSTLIPAFVGRKDARLVHVATTTGLTALDAQRAFGFVRAGTDATAVLADPEVDLVVITTRHNSHAKLVVQALDAGKHVFVEKPLALDEAGLAAVEAALAKSSGMLMVGFNRRFSPLSVDLRGALAGRGPVMATARVNAGSLSGHWLNDREIGGGRMIGEGCHFVDLLSMLCGDQEIVGVDARTVGTRAGMPEDFCVQLAFADGSVGQLSYSALGNAAMGKERVEAFAGGSSGFIDDFASGSLFSAAGTRKLKGKGKGHREEVEALLAAIRRGGQAPISPGLLLGVSRATLAVHEVLAGRQA